MRHFYKITTVALVAALLFSLTSCMNIPGIKDLIPDGSSASSSESDVTTTSATESETSDTTTTTTSETTAASETTESSVTEVFASDTSESSETSPSTSPDDTSSENDCSFSPDGLLKAAKNADVKVYKDVDSFLDNYKALVNKDKKAVKNYKKGAAIKVSGSDIDKISNTIGNQAAQDGDFMSHASDMTMLMAGDISNGAYTVVILSYVVDDPSVIDDWYDRSTKDFASNLPDQYKDNEMFSLKSVNDTDGDIRYFMTSFTINDDIAKKNLFPENAGAFSAAYAQGRYGMYITAVDFDINEAGINMLTSLCKSMKIKNPADF